MDKEIGRKRSELPIACNLSGREEAKRRREVAESVFGGAQQVKELADGYSFAFPGSAEWGSKLMDFINSERVCCPFFTFELIFEPYLGQIWLRVRGEEGVKEFIEKELDAP